MERNFKTDLGSDAVLKHSVDVEQQPSNEENSIALRGERYDSSVSPSEAAAIHFAEDELELYLLGRLPHQTAQEVEGHITTCVPCQKRMADEQATINAINLALRVHWLDLDEAIEGLESLIQKGDCRKH